MITLSTEALCFKCTTSPQTFIMADRCVFGKLYYSPDGIKFFELKNQGFSGTATVHHVSFADPHHNLIGEFEREGNTLTWGSKTFEKDSCPDQIDAVPLPVVRRAEYLFRLKRGVYIYVSADSFNFSYESFKLFIGKAARMKEVPVFDVQRYRDGGTTYVKTAAGLLFSPTPFDTEKRPIWNGVEIKKLDPKDFVIEENRDTVVIVRR